MILPWAHRLISAGAHGMRRIPGQSVNLAHLIWRAPRAPAPLQGAPPVVFRAGLWVLVAKSPFSPLRGHIGACADTPRVGKRCVPTAATFRFPARGVSAYTPMLPKAVKGCLSKDKTKLIPHPPNLP